MAKKQHKTKKRVTKTPVLLNSTANEMSAGGIMGNVAAGAGSGALMGLSAGPLAPITAGMGALIGGGVGLVKGLLGHRQENLANLEQERLTEQQGMQPVVPPLASTRTFGSDVSSYSNIPTFKYGGAMGAPRATQMTEMKSIPYMVMVG